MGKQPAVGFFHLANRKSVPDRLSMQRYALVLSHWLAETNSEAPARYPGIWTGTPAITGFAFAGGAGMVSTVDAPQRNTRQLSERRGENHRYPDGSLWRVALTADKIPKPSSTIAPTTIQCVGTCIKWAP